MKNLTRTELKTLRDTAITAAAEAGQYIQSQFDQHYVKQTKVGGDSLASQIVTEVDIEAQRIILSYLEESIGSHDLGLLTEESEDDESRAVKDYFWCIDPMDGTLPFTEQRTGYAVSIALISNAGDPVIGVVYIPDLADCYASIQGEGVSLNNQPFMRNESQDKNTIHVFMDQSFKAESYFEFVTTQLEALTLKSMARQIVYHSSFGGVRNAIGVMSSGAGCYFKFPKSRPGCGSIWDYAATRLFFEELGLPVSDAKGASLHLNNTTTTFMNHGGILYSTNDKLVKSIQEIGAKVADRV